MIPFKAVLEDPSVVIVDKHSPHTNAGLLVLRHTFLPEWWTKVFGAPRADLAIVASTVPAFLALLADPAIQLPRALRPVQSLIRASK